jgi:uncharacterized protein
VEKMRILFDITHPAHVHLFKHSWPILRSHGHSIYIVARFKDVLVDLLKHYNEYYQVVSEAKGGFVNNFKELVKRDFEILKIVKRNNIDLLVGSTFSIPHVGWLCNIPSIAFSEDDISYKIDRGLNYRIFRSLICTPDAIKDNLGKRHIKYPSYQKLAYLHPNRFIPDPSILSDLDLGQNERFFILRFVAFKAYHDTFASGINPEIQKRLVFELSKYGRVFITTEGYILPELEHYQLNIPPTKIHDVLYYASLFIGDSQTMTVEAAILGTPSIRCNTFVGKCSIIEELQHKYGLTFGFLPKQNEEMFQKIFELLEDEDVHNRWQEKRTRMLNDKIDLTSWMVDLIETYAINRY